jgi:uncharacterized protein (TIGR03067 family)
MPLMTRRLIVILTLIAGTLWLVPAARAQNRAGDLGAGPIEGTWTVTGSEREGNPWREIAGASMTIMGGQFTLQFTNNGPVYKGDIKQVGGPEDFDLVQKEGPDAGKTWQALVSSNGQLLKICFTHSGENGRPTSLTTSPGEGTTLIGLRRK